MARTLEADLVTRWAIDQVPLSSPGRSLAIPDVRCWLARAALRGIRGGADFPARLDNKTPFRCAALREHSPLARRAGTCS